MIKLSPSDKKLLVLLLVLFVIIFSIFIIDFVLNTKSFFDVSKTIDMSSTLESVVEKIKEKPKNPEPSMIRKSLNDFFELMNNKEYENLFELLSPDFKKEYFNDDLDIFSEFMKSYSDAVYSPYFTEYTRFDDTYMVLVSFVPYSNLDENIIETQSPKKSDTFFLHFTSDNNCTFSFLGYVGEKEMGNGVQNSKFKVILNKTVLHKTKSEFYFTITNNTDTPISIIKKTIYCYTGMKSRFYNNSVYVPPHSSTDFTFSVGTGASIASAVPSKIYFGYVVVDNEKYEFSIDTDFCVDL